MPNLRFLTTAALLICSFLTQCTILQNATEFLHKQSFTAGTENVSISLHKIDNAQTYEFYFLLLEGEAKIKIDARQEKSPEATQGNDNLRPLFYVVEKHYLEKVSESNTREFFITIGKNHSSSWQIQNAAVFTTKSSDPLLKLEPGIYRIRFTAFTQERFDFSFVISTQKKTVVISSEMGDLIGIVQNKDAEIEKTEQPE